MCLKTSLDWLACWSPYMSQQHCVVNDLYTLSGTAVHEDGSCIHGASSHHCIYYSVLPFVYQCFCRSTASGAVLWSFLAQRSMSDLCWGSHGAVGETRMSIMLLPWIHSAGIQQVLVIVFLLDFTERVLTPSSQKHTASDYSTYAVSSRSTQWRNIWNIKKGKTQGEMSKLLLLLTIYLHPFTLFTNRKNHKNTNYHWSRTTKSNKTKRDLRKFRNLYKQKIHSLLPHLLPI